MTVGAAATHLLLLQLALAAGASTLGLLRPPPFAEVACWWYASAAVGTVSLVFRIWSWLA
jgi:hypothetical protein